MSYISVDAIAEKVVSLGKNTLLAKMDIKEAYRMVPVHPQDRRLLGTRWEGSVYVDKVLPFGLRSVPLIFSAVTDALQWMLRQKGVSFVEHYLDDFITLGNQARMSVQSAATGDVQGNRNANRGKEN